jgi:translation initiation factor 3 subunit B
MFDEFERYAKVPEQYAAPETKAYQPQENLNNWMLDKFGRDQFVLRHGDETSVFWNDGKRSRAEQVYSRNNWTESFIQWSPHGNLLATMHRQGVAVWGGPSFIRLQRFSHPNVRLIDISPNEKFLITYSSMEPSNPRESVTVNFTVFDIRSGRKLRVFEGAADEFAIGCSAGPGGVLKWPVFKWAGGREDSYVARIGKNLISIYATPEMGLLDKKSLKLEAVQDFEWSPAEALLAAYTAEQGNLPARITLVKIPERTEVRQKNLFNVSEVKIIWHPQGDYLAVKVDRFTKTKKSTYTGFELFSIRDKDIPMEVLELPNKNDKVISLAWEPKGHRFCVVHGEGPRPNISFYSMKDDKGRLGVRLLGTFVNKACTSIHWSPQGKNIVIAGLKSMNGQLEFFNVDELETLATAEHFMCTDIEWDPTGRYVATSVTSIHQMENGFNLWSFQGKLLYSMPKDRLFQFSWRPRLPSLLPPEKDAEIVKNLKQYSKRYDEEDEALVMQADQDVIQERQRLMDEFNAWFNAKKNSVSKVADFRAQVYGPRYAEREFTVQSAFVEQILEVKEEPYNAR